MQRRIGAAWLAIGMVVVLGAPVMAQDASASPAAGPWTVVVQGLDSPRGLAFGPDGRLYVAEAGEGGSDTCIDDPRGGTACLGATAGISVVADGTATRVIDGLTSISSGQEVIGPADVAVSDAGDIYFTTPLGGAPEVRAMAPGDFGETLGYVFKGAIDGSYEVVADLVQYEADNNPDSDQPGTEIDSNPNSVAVAPDGSLLVVDAGGNDLLMVAADGTVTTGAVFPFTVVTAPVDPSTSPDPNASPTMMPMQPVPTSVTIGPDEAAYVGQLTGFPFPVGGASVFRVVPGEQPTVYATGFTNVMDLAFGPDGTLYVLEIAHNSLLSGDMSGGLWSVPAGGGEPVLLATDGLLAPGGVAVDASGTVYVSNGSVMPNGGSIVTLDQ